MKKLIAGILIATLSFILFGCGSAEKPGEVVPETQETTTEVRTARTIYRLCASQNGSRDPWHHSVP